MIFLLIAIQLVVNILLDKTRILEKQFDSKSPLLIVFFFFLWIILSFFPASAAFNSTHFGSDGGIGLLLSFAGFVINSFFSFIIVFATQLFYSLVMKRFFF